MRGNIKHEHHKNMEEKISENKENKPDFEKESYYGIGGFLWEVIKVFLWAIVIIVPIRMFLFQPFFVQGASMEPNFKDGDYLIINEFGYKQTDINIAGKHFFSFNSFKDLQRLDTIVFRYPKNPKQFFIKRIVGLPGEKVKIENGKVKIYNEQNPDGLVLDESEYLAKNVITSGSLDINLGENQYFVLGDNRSASYDSRGWGVLPQEDIIGKVFVRAWPFSAAGVF